jgi:DNA (cytosine-5)-methyltransferase 1
MKPGNRGVSPTLNAFDNTGDSRATVIIVAASFKPGASAQARSIGYEEEMAPTLESGGGGNNKPAVIIFTAQRVGEPPRIYEDITPSLLSRMGTGGNNTPMIAIPEEPIAFDSVASGGYKIHHDGKAPPNKTGSPTAVAYDEYNNSLDPHVHHAIRAGTKQSTGVITRTVVRRLTPIECERLMGWPDNHTLNRADGKTNSDSTRYKMCGNGVATPVAYWIADQLKELL